MVAPSIEFLLGDASFLTVDTSDVNGHSACGLRRLILDNFRVVLRERHATPNGTSNPNSAPFVTLVKPESTTGQQRQGSGGPSQG
jgi:hypothetical protein